MTAATQAGLIEFGMRVRFRHPLVRSVVYGLASPGERQEVHAALAAATDPELDPDRRAWHSAHASAGPDEAVAAELERALAAASANLQAGAFDVVRHLLSAAEAGAITDMQQARVDLLAADLAFVTNRGSDAPSLLLKAAKRLEPIDADLSRATYLKAFSAAMLAGPLALDGGVQEVTRAAGGAPPPTRGRRAPDFLLDGLVAHFEAGYAAGLPLLRKALDVFGVGMSVDEQLRCHWIAGVAATHVWDDDRWHLLSERHVELARDVGALTELPLALNARAFIVLFTSELADVAALVQELEAVTEATGIKLARYAAMGLEAMRGRREETAVLVDAAIRDVSLRGEGNGIAVAEWATAVLNNGVGDYLKAMTAARYATEYPGRLISPTWAPAELVEAAVRSGHNDVAADALCRLAEIAHASGTDWVLGVAVRSRAAAERGRRRRTPLSRVDRAAWPYAYPHRTRPGSSALRRMAAARVPPHRRTRPASHRPRHAGHDGNGRFRRACQA
jgi:hypothetical protein